MGVRLPVRVLLVAGIVSCLAGLLVQRASALPVVVATLPTGDKPYGVGVDATRGRVFVANKNSNTVTVLDGLNLAVLKTIAVGSEPQLVAVNETTHRVYVPNYVSRNVAVLDGDTLAVITYVPVGKGPWGVGVHTGANRVYVSNQEDNSVSVIDGSSNTVLTTIKVGSGPAGVAVNETTNRVFVANYQSDNVTVIDSGSNSVVATIPVGDDPNGIAANARTNRVYVANYLANSVTVIDGSGNTVLTNIPVGARPYFLAADVHRDRVYVGNSTANTVSVVAGSTNTVAGTVSVGMNPYGVGVDPLANRVYVANSSADTLSVLWEPIAYLPLLLRPGAASLTPTPTPTRYNGVTPTATPSPPPTTTATATPTTTATATATPSPWPTPTATRTPTGTAAQGIQGRVTFHGSAASHLALGLRYFNGETWSIRATTTTDEEGRYAFYPVPGLGAGEEYYVRYFNAPTAPNPGPTHLYLWYGNLISSYTSGADAAGGDFEVVDLPLQSPPDGANRVLPAEFCWTPRDEASDNYRLILYDSASDELAVTEWLGDAACVILGALPDDWASGATYRWWVEIGQGDDPDANLYNLGWTYGDRLVKLSFANGAPPVRGHAARPVKSPPGLP